MKKQESKYFYTASLMNQALIALLEKKDIEYITVTEITKKAGVNRSTFYLHYENVYELLEETIHNLNKSFLTSFDEKGGVKITSKENAFLVTSDRLVAYLHFCKENRRVLRLINKKPGLFQSKETYQKMYDTIFYPAISKFVQDEAERVYFLEFYTRGVAAIIHKWMEMDCVTDVEKIVEIINACVAHKK